MLENKTVETYNLPIKQIHPRWKTLASCSTKEARFVLSKNRALELKALPLAVYKRSDETLLSLAVTDSSNLQALRFTCGLELSCEEVRESDLMRAIELSYAGVGSELIAEDEEPRILLRKILLRAQFLESSDIHLEPDRTGSRLRLRRNGRMVSEASTHIERARYSQLVRHTKVLCKLDITEQLNVQEGSFIFESERKEELTVRVSILPTLHGEKLAFRLQTHNFLEEALIDGDYDFSGLGLSGEQSSLLNLFMDIDRGAILVAGATGSGKTTLLYSIIKKLSQRSVHILSVEDPIEHDLPAVNQVQVTKGMAEVLPAVLRQDPDVLMVGEIRNSETADLALGAALTGSLVCTSVHASSVFETLSRMHDLGISPIKMASSIRLIIACRLVAKNCEYCALPTSMPSSFMRYFSLGTERLLSSAGCEQCLQTGVHGRVGVYEFLPIGAAISNSLSKGRLELQEIQNLASNCGFEPILSIVSGLLSRGVVSPAEVCKALGLSLQLFQK